MESVIDYARKVVSEFDEHLICAWNSEIRRREENGDVEGVVMMQDCGDVILLLDSALTDTVEMLSAGDRNGSRSQLCIEKFEKRNKANEILCKILDYEWIEEIGKNLEGARRLIFEETTRAAHEIEEERGWKFDFYDSKDRMILQKRLGASFDEYQSVECEALLRWRVTISIARRKELDRRRIL